MRVDVPVVWLDQRQCGSVALRAGGFRRRSAGVRHGFSPLGGFIDSTNVWATFRSPTYRRKINEPFSSAMLRHCLDWKIA